MARPTLYSKEMLDAALEYIQGGYIGHDQVVPSIAGMAVALGVARSTLYVWAEDHDEFSDMLALTQDVQESIALNKGLASEFNATIVKLLLAKHGYSDKQELAHSSPDGSMTPQVIERHIIDPKAPDTDS